MAFGAWELIRRGAGSRARPLAIVVCVLLGAVAISGVRAQTAHWGSHLALFERALAVTDDNFFAHTEVGVALVAAGRTAEAIPHFEAAARIHPGYARARANLGNAWLTQGDYERAVAELVPALRARPDLERGFRALGRAYEGLGRRADATRAYAVALGQQPGARGIRVDLARTAALLALESGGRAVVPMGSRGDVPASALALEMIERECAAAPCVAPRARFARALALRAAGRVAESNVEAEAALARATELGDFELAEQIAALRDRWFTAR